MHDKAYEKAIKLLCIVLGVWGDLEELQVSHQELCTIKIMDVENEDDEEEEEEEEEKDSEQEEKEQTLYFHFR